MISQKTDFCKYEVLIQEGFEGVNELARMDDLLKSFFENLTDSGKLAGADAKIVDRMELMLELYFSWCQCYRDAIEWNLRDIKKLLQAQTECEPVNIASRNGVFTGELGT